MVQRAKKTRDIRRTWNRINQDEKYPGFWQQVRKLLPGMSVNKELILSDLIRLYIESNKPKPIRQEHDT